jgi:beta-N-acetylhexosaminidase
MSGSSGIGLPGTLGIKYRGRFWLYPLSVRYVRPIVFSVLVLTSVLVAGCGDPLLTTTTSGGPGVQLGTSGTGLTAPNPAEPATNTTLADTTSSTASAPTTSVSLSPAHAAVESMTLRQKAAQVLLVSLDGTTLTDPTRGVLSERAPAGFVLLGRNVTGESQLRSLAASLQEAASAAGAPGLFIAADQEGGTVMRVKEGVPKLPSARALATDSSTSKAQNLAEQTASGLLSQGVNMVLAPVADVVTDRDSFLFSRSYGGEPDSVTGFVAAVVQGYVETGMVTVVKHFPGHGSAPGNSHTAVPVSTATKAEFARIHLPPFGAAIAAGADGVMMGHLLIPAYDRLHPASQSKTIVNDLLRGELGFSGLVVTDDLEMAAAAGRAGQVGTATPAELGDSAVSALAAGCDLLITTGTMNRQNVIVQAIVDAVQTGKLAEERLDEAVSRILSAKLEHSIPVPVSPRP